MDGRNVVSLHPCRVRMLKLREDYDFSREDPQIFHEDEGDPHFKPHRAWPGITLPNVPPPKVIKALPKGPSGKPAVLSVLSDPDKEEFKRIHMEALQFHVRMLDSIGIDGVQELLDQRGIQALQCIRKDSDHCRICSRVFKSVQRLREHIIKEHCPPSYQHFCDYEGCEFVGGSKGELNEHAKIHAKPAKKGSELHCGPCNKSFPSLSKKTNMTFPGTPNLTRNGSEPVSGALNKREAARQPLSISTTSKPTRQSASSSQEVPLGMGVPCAVLISLLWSTGMTTAEPNTLVSTLIPKKRTS